MNEIVFFDLDNTMVDGFTHTLFAKYLFRKKLISTQALLVIGFLQSLYKAGLIKNPKKPYEFGLSFAKGYSYKKAEKIIDEFYKNEHSNRIFPKIKQIINEHLSKNRRVVIISNQADILVKKVAKEFGVSDYICTKIEVDQEGNFTGKIDGEIVYSSRKKKVAQEFLVKNHLTSAFTWAYADHHSDIDLLEFVNKPIAVNPDKILRKYALENAWEILDKKDLY